MTVSAAFYRHQVRYVIIGALPLKHSKPRYQPHGRREATRRSGTTDCNLCGYGLHSGPWQHMQVRSLSWETCKGTDSSSQSFAAMEGGCGIAEAAGYGAGRQVPARRILATCPREDNRPYGRWCFAIALGGI